MGYRYKLVTLDPERGDVWPKYCWYESWGYRGDIEKAYKDIINGEHYYHSDVAAYKAGHNMEGLVGTVVGDKIRAIILEEDPEMNEFGEVSP